MGRCFKMQKVAVLCYNYGIEIRVTVASRFRLTLVLNASSCKRYKVMYKQYFIIRALIVGSIVISCRDS